LLAFWAKHMWHTTRGVDDWTKTTWDDISDLADQKSLEDDVKGSTTPSPPELTHDLKYAAASFTHLKTYLCTCRSRKTGLPLEYVTRVNIREPFDGPEDAPEDLPAYGHQDSPFVSIDEELIARAPILRHDTPHEQLAATDEFLEANGPFERGFILDSAEVFDILHTVWGKSSWWTHCKAFTKTKNGRQAFRTLHAQPLGGPTAIASGAAILAQLQASSTRVTNATSLSTSTSSCTCSSTTSKLTSRIMASDPSPRTSRSYGSRKVSLTRVLRS
jgi:hypothetical protein